MLKCTVSQLLEIVKRGFDELFWGFEVLLECEVSRATKKGKYSYLEVIQSDLVTGELIAKTKVAIFNSQVLTRFLSQTKMPSIDQIVGQKILLRGRLSFHGEYGFSVICEELSAEYTIWQLQIKQTSILQELTKLWIAEHNKQTSLWFPPFTIAVISSQQAQGYIDFMTVLQETQINVNLVLYESSVHGVGAHIAVTEQLNAIQLDINAWKSIDLVALLRGGGGSEGMLRQNDFELARAVCSLSVPMIVAVGHTTDTSVLDHICKRSAKTPTDAAYFVRMIYDDTSEQVRQKFQSISMHVQTIFQRYQFAVQALTEHCLDLAKWRIADIRARLEVIHSLITTIAPEKLKDQWYALIRSHEGKYLSRDEVRALSAGDTFVVNVYDKQIKVSVLQS